MTDRTRPIHEDNCAPTAHWARRLSPRACRPDGAQDRRDQQSFKRWKPKRAAACGKDACRLRPRIAPPGRSSQQVKAAIRDFARQGVDLVVVNGGDGTIHAVLTALFTTEWPDHVPFLALLRAGTTSMIARDVGLPGSRLQGLSRLLGWAYAGAWCRLSCQTAGLASGMGEGR